MKTTKKRKRETVHEDEEYRHFTRKGKPLKYRTRNLANKEVDELLLMDKLPDSIDNTVAK